MSIEQLVPNDSDWQQLCKTLKAAATLTALVLAAWQMGLWLARAIVEQQLQERAQVATQWTCCAVCGTQLHEHWLCQTAHPHTGWMDRVETASGPLSPSVPWQSADSARMLL